MLDDGSIAATRDRWTTSIRPSRTERIGAAEGAMLSMRIVVVLACVGYSLSELRGGGENIGVRKRKTWLSVSSTLARQTPLRDYDFLRSAAPGYAGRNALLQSGWCSAVFGVRISALLVVRHHRDGKQAARSGPVALIESLPASGLKGGSPDTAMSFQASLAERHMLRVHSTFVLYRRGNCEPPPAYMESGTELAPEAKGQAMAIAKNTICVWYDKDAEAAARFYAETFPNSSVGAVHYAPSDFPSGKAGDALMVEFTVAGIPCLGLNGGPAFKHNEAFSFQIATDDQ